NPPGCTIFSVIFSNEGIEEVAVLTAGTIFSHKFPSKISHF
ncbi:hypothetical protein HMPREF1602_04935, partial [Escherichia coli 907889]